MALQRVNVRSRPLWLLFLQSVTGERPAMGSDTVDDAANAWREWGRRRGLVP